MKKWMFFPAALGASLGLSATLHAAQPRAVDVLGFDIAGVKLGMELAQARSAMAAYFGIPPSAVELEYQAQPSPLTGTELPMRLRYEKEGEEVLVNLEPRLPINAKATTFASTQVVRHWPQGSRSKEQVFEGARARYGAPSGVVGQRMLWCARPSADPAVVCLQGNPAVLAVSAKGEALFDIRRVDARVEAEMAARAGSGRNAQQSP